VVKIFNILEGSASIVVKTVIAAVVLFILAQLMGEKQISQLTFFDYIVGVSIGIAIKKSAALIPVNYKPERHRRRLCKGNMPFRSSETDIL
jgi:hypothetical protein